MVDAISDADYSNYLDLINESKLIEQGEDGYIIQLPTGHQLFAPPLPVTNDPLTQKAETINSILRLTYQITHQPDSLSLQPALIRMRNHHNTSTLDRIFQPAVLNAWEHLAFTQPISMTSLLINLSSLDTSSTPLGFPNKRTESAFAESLHIIGEQPEYINGITYTPPLLTDCRYAIPLTDENPLLTSLASVTLQTLPHATSTSQISEFLSITLPNNGYRIATLQNENTGKLEPHLVFDNPLTANGGHGVPDIISRIITGHENIGEYGGGLTIQVLSTLDHLIENKQAQEIQPLASILTQPVVDKPVPPVHKSMKR